MKQRILERTINGAKSYIIQEKFLFWWFKKPFVEIGYYSGFIQYTLLEFFSWNSLEKAKYIKDNYREHDYKGYTIYPCITYTYGNGDTLAFYLDVEYKKDKILGNLDELKSIIDRWTHKDVITKRVVEED